MSFKTIPASMHAVFTHKFLAAEMSAENLQRIPITHEYMFQTWLPRSGYTHLCDIYLIERMLAGHSGIDMLIPIKPKT